jgi:thiol-disulfide isomerase/thioredoxin
MKSKKIAVAAVLALLAGAGLTAMAGCSSDDSGSSASESTEQATTAGGASSGGAYGSDRSPGGESSASGQDANTAAAGSAAKQPGQFVDYSPELVDSTPGEKLLFFHAPWCSQCVALEEDIEANGVPDGVTIFKVDYDSNQDLRQEYGVTIQTTIVKVDDNGEKVETYVAYDEPTLDSVSAALLQ